MHKTETLNLRVSPEFKRRLAEEAKKERRSVTNYIEAALSDYWNLRSRRRSNKAKISQSE
jgi:predicted HicB family RNase H-like nuclease